MTPIEIFELIVRSMTFVSIAIAAISLFRSSKYARRQWNFNAFTHYTKRYDDIMSSFPDGAYMLRFDLDQPVKSNEDVRLAVLKYLNMTSEEYYLWRDGYLDDQVWKIWLPEIKRTLRTPLFVREWGTLKREFHSYPDFARFVDEAQSDVLLLPERRAKQSA